MHSGSVQTSFQERKASQRKREMTFCCDVRRKGTKMRSCFSIAVTKPHSIALRFG